MRCDLAPGHHELLTAMIARDLAALETIVRPHRRGALGENSELIRRHEAH